MVITLSAILPLIEVLGLPIIVVAAVILILREVLRHKRATTQIEQRQASNNLQRINISNLFDNIPMVLDQTTKLYEEQKAASAGLTPEEQQKVLKPLESRIKQLQWVQNNEWWLRTAAPYMDSVFKNIMKWFK